MKSKITDPEKVSVGGVLKKLILNFCIGFTVFMLISMVFGTIFADEASKEGILMCWTIAGVMLVAALMQMVFFTPVVIKRMGYVPRLIAFGIVFYLMLYACGAVFDWFPAHNVGAWVSFTVIYLVILGLMSAVFTALYRKNVATLNEGLKDFKEKMREITSGYN